MRPHAIRDGIDAGRIAEEDRNASSLLQRPAVELEPARRATPWQPPVRDGDVRLGAGAGKRGPVDALRGADREQPQPLRALPDLHDAGIARAVAGRPGSEERGLPVERRGFGGASLPKIEASCLASLTSALMSGVKGLR